MQAGSHRTDLLDGQRRTPLALINLNAIADAQKISSRRSQRSSPTMRTGALLRECSSSHPAGRFATDGDDLPNVGAIRDSNRAADAIERTPGLVAYRERLRAARERAARAGARPPRTLRRSLPPTISRRSNRVSSSGRRTRSHDDADGCGAYLAAFYARGPALAAASVFAATACSLAAAHLLDGASGSP